MRLKPKKIYFIYIFIFFADNEFMKPVLLFSLISLLSYSCIVRTPPPTGQGFVQQASQAPDNPRPVVRQTPKKPDIEKQRRCGKGSTTVDLCKDSSTCMNACDDVFTGRANKKDCYELPEELVFEFEDLLDATEDGEIDLIRPFALECLLDIDDREFTKAIGKMSRSEAKEFLYEITYDDELAEILEDEDDDYFILKDLLKQATGKSNLVEQLGTTIEDGKNFLHLAGEGVEEAWEWLDNYVTEEGDTDDPLSTYSRVLAGMNKRDLEDFLDDADNFEDEYRSEVEDDNYRYTEDSFRVWVKLPAQKDRGNLRSSASPTPTTPTPTTQSGDCPASGGSFSARKIVEITTQTSGPTGDLYEFYTQGPFCYMNGNSQVPEPTPARPSPSDPVQNIILVLRDYGSENGLLIVDRRNLDYKSNNDYYLYIGNKRYSLSREKDYRVTPSNCSGVSTTRRLIQWDDFLGSNSIPGNGPHEIALAYKPPNGACKFIEFP